MVIGGGWLHRGVANRMDIRLTCVASLVMALCAGVVVSVPLVSVRFVFLILQSLYLIIEKVSEVYE